MTGPLLPHEMEQAVCPCGSTLVSRTIPSADPYTGLLFNYQQCGSCGLEFLSPRPRREVIMRFYPEGYGPHDPGRHRPEPIREFLFNTVLSTYFPKSRPPTAWLRITRPLLRLLLWPLRHRPLLAFRAVEPRRVFEFGVGTGEDLARFRAAGWETAGCEPSLAACAYLQERFGSMQSCPAEEAVLEDEHYSALLMNNVFEHVHDPIGILGKCRNALVGDGVLILIVPNHRYFLAKMFEGISPIYDPPRHLWGFSPEPLSRLLHDNGFQVETIDHRAPLLWFWRMSALKWLQLHRIPASVVTCMSRFLGMLLVPLGIAAALGRRGPYIKVVARKRAENGAIISSA